MEKHKYLVRKAASMKIQNKNMKCLILGDSLNTFNGLICFNSDKIKINKPGKWVLLIYLRKNKSKIQLALKELSMISMIWRKTKNSKRKLKRMVINMMQFNKVSKISKFLKRIKPQKQMLSTLEL